MNILGTLWQPLSALNPVAKGLIRSYRWSTMNSRIMRQRIRLRWTFMSNGIHYGWVSSKLSFLEHCATLYIIAIVSYMYLDQVGNSLFTGKRLSNVFKFQRLHVNSGHCLFFCEFQTVWFFIIPFFHTIIVQTLTWFVVMMILKPMLCILLSHKLCKTVFESMPT